MKIITRIRFFLFLVFLLRVDLLAQESDSSDVEFISIEHFNHIENLEDNSEHALSHLKKTDADYKLIQTSGSSMEIRKYTSDIEYEVLYFVRPNLHFGFHDLTSRLIDVYVDGTTEEVSMLLSQTQGYVYLKSIKNYTPPPLGEYAFDEMVYLEQDWKPLLMIKFVPPELDPIYFSEKILEYNSTSLTGIDTFQIRSLDANNNEKADSYLFSNDGVKKNGLKFEEFVLVFKRAFASQLEFLDTVDSASDEDILAHKEVFSNSVILEALSSFDDQPRAQAVKVRIEALLNE